MRQRCLGIAAVAAALCAQPSPVIQTETRVVLVDAIVTAKNGKYVRDLTARDFRIWQDNQEQTIKSFALEAASTASQPRSLVLLFDETSMEARDQVPVLQAASRFIDAETGPNRRMAVAVYNGVLRVAQTFTDNAGRLKEALPAPEANVREQEDAQPRQRAGAPVNSASADLGARNLLPALRNLGSSLAVLPGRKIVVLFRGGLSATSQLRSEIREVADACNRADVAIYPVDARSVSAQVDTDPSPTALPVDRGPVRAVRGQLPPPQIHGDAADDLGLAPETGAGSQQMLFALANGTGGFVIRNSNDFLAELQKIAAEQDEYYAITYTPPESKEGACHKLRVKVDRSGATVRARNAYCTTRSPDLLTGTSAGKDLEKRAAGTETGDITAALALPYFYVSPNRARVHVAMEIAPGGVKFENRKGRLHAEINILGIAATPEGEVRARFSDVLTLDFENPAQFESLKGNPVHYEKQFQIVPGQYNFTVVVGQGSASFGKLDMPLAIEPWAGAGLALSSLALSRETRPAADLGLGLVAEDRTPLTADGLEVVPSGSRQFTRSEPALFYFEVYSLDAPSVRVRVRLLDRQTGEQKWDSGLMKLPAPKEAATPSKIPAGSPLPVRSLPPGAYQLEVTVTDSSARQARHTADLTIE